MAGPACGPDGRVGSPFGFGSGSGFGPRFGSAVRTSRAAVSRETAPARQGAGRRRGAWSAPNPAPTEKTSGYVGSEGTSGTLSPTGRKEAGMVDLTSDSPASTASSGPDACVRQPEGRRREDHNRRQRRGLPRRRWTAGARGRSRPPGQRDERARRGASRGRRVRLRRPPWRRGPRLPDRAHGDARALARSVVDRPRRRRGGAGRRPAAGAPAQPRDRVRPLRFRRHLHRLPAVARPAHGERPDGGRRRADPDAVRVLRARGPLAADRDDPPRARPPEPGARGARRRAHDVRRAHEPVGRGCRRGSRRTSGPRSSRPSCPRSVRLSEAPSHGRPIAALRSRQPRRHAYRALATELPSPARPGGGPARRACRDVASAGAALPPTTARTHDASLSITVPRRTCRSTQARAHPAGRPDGATGVAGPRPRRAHSAGRLHDARAGGDPDRPHRAEPVPAANRVRDGPARPASREHRGARRPAAGARDGDARRVSADRGRASGPRRAARRPDPHPGHRPPGGRTRTARAGARRERPASRPERRRGGARLPPARRRVRAVPRRDRESGSGGRGRRSRTRSASSSSRPPRSRRSGPDGSARATAGRCWGSIRPGRRISSP